MGGAACNWSQRQGWSAQAVYLSSATRSLSEMNAVSALNKVVFPLLVRPLIKRCAMARVRRESEQRRAAKQAWVLVDGKRLC